MTKRREGEEGRERERKEGKEEKEEGGREREENPKLTFKRVKLSDICSHANPGLH